MIFSHIVARTAQQYVIGKNNSIPWHLPADLKRFKQLTLNHPILMGRKTFQSLPGSKPLANRRHIVVSKSLPTQPGIEVVSSIFEAQNLIQNTCSPTEEIFIIGGGEIYRETMPLVSKIYFTIVYKEFDGDVFYPKDWNKNKKFEELNFQKFNEPMEYAFWDLKVKNT